MNYGTWIGSWLGPELQRGVPSWRCGRPVAMGGERPRAGAAAYSLTNLIAVVQKWRPRPSDRIGSSDQARYNLNVRAPARLVGTLRLDQALAEIDGTRRQ
jgi:hypothetical protein